MFKQLKSAHFEANQVINDKNNELVRDCMLVYEGVFNSLDGEVTIDEATLSRMMESHNGRLKRLVESMGENIASRFYPPIQLDHSTSAKDTVGRLTGAFTMGEYTPEGGTPVKALYGKLKILGADNVEKVADGRWTHLSIGADLETGKISELTITPFPAAADASMLAAARLSKETVTYKDYTIEIQKDAGGVYSATCGKDGAFTGSSKEDVVSKAKKHIDELTKKLAQGDDMNMKEMAAKVDMYNKCKKHLMDTTKCTEDDADKKLSEMSDDETTSMAKEVDVAMSKLAADQEAADKAKKDEESKLAAADEEKEVVKKAEMSRLMKGVSGFNTKVQLAAKKSKIQNRLSYLKTQAKITPAEIKTIDLTKMSAQTDVEVDAFFKGFEARQPQVLVGIYGDSRSADIAQLMQNKDTAKYLKEMQEDMPSMARLSADMKSEQEKALAADPDMAQQMPDQLPDIDVEKEHLELCAMMDAPDKKEEFKMKLKELLKKASMSKVDFASTDEEMKQLSDEAAKMDETMKQLAKMANVEV